ncbi:HpcH/HpaI aldolase/citrate lyase family protein [Microbulbifer variabilis]|uniref:HpcH/HpaI aldolase/citrate lyase family protein n=1 Tax=Microbulbifer variabilis TaxID=266805 RepID=UPI001CFF18D7|nr:CoA ester lyase [Microbulbifer variabilis]
MHGYWSSREEKSRYVKITAMHLKKSFLCRSILFVPATRPDRFQKAIASGADMACMDLEDAVAPELKETARQNIVNFFPPSGALSVLRALRINQLTSELGLRDMLLLLEQVSKPDIVLLPKVESAEEIAWFNNLTASVEQSIGILPLIETAKGLQNSMEIASSKNVLAVAFGSADFSAEMGADMGWESLLYARGRILQAAANANIDAIDGPHLDIEDTAGLLHEVQRVAALGFSGKIALHPSQIAPIHRGFTPTEEALQRARKIVQAFKENPSGVVVVDGRMVDLPVVERAQKLVSLAERQ